MKKLDERDQKILTLLERDARLPISELARQIALSPTAVRQRIARMEKDQVIKRYTIDMKRGDEEAGIKVIMILNLKGAYCKKLVAELGHLPELRKFWSLTGEVDVTLLLNVSNVERIGCITNQISDHELVDKVQTHVVTETHLDR
ncbi:Lrp/AsnC family transcriptional regulator [Kiloniella antarctica]|uniref:Lrp/AsnC family transcriptional regulator n=2 Tax=Kiloniella antarctica TaxID=1550907 RepID=A0ABW5BP82_9PROT